MAGMCKSDQMQNVKNRAKFVSKANQKTWETHKAKKAKRIARQEELRMRRVMKRLLQGKPQRGDARKARRSSLFDGC